MATLGLTTTSSSNDASGTGTVLVNGWFQTGTPGGLLVDGQAFLNAALGVGASQATRLVIYPDSAGVPSTTLFGVTDEVVVTHSTPATWVVFPTWVNFGGAPTFAANTKYWVGMWYGTQVSSGVFQNNVTLAAAAATTQFQTGVTYSTTANPSVASWQSAGNSNAYAIYFDYTPGGLPARALTALARTPANF